MVLVLLRSYFLDPIATSLDGTYAKITQMMFRV